MIDPSVIVIGSSPAAAETSAALRAAIDRADIISVTDARYRALRIGAALFPLLVLPDPTPDDTLSAIAILDTLLPDRLEAISRLWQALGRSPSSKPGLTQQRRSRLRQILRVFDARRAGTSYRGIAEALFPQHRIDAMSWAGNALRETTIRLVRDGAKLVAGGYRTLLRRPRKR